jgi:hypothetical protein
MEFLEQTFYKIDDLTIKRIILEDLNTEFGVKAPADFVSNRNTKLNEFITVVYSSSNKTEKERISIQDAIENILMTSDNISESNKKKLEKLFPPSRTIQGNGANKKGKKLLVFGDSYLSQKIHTQKIDNYIPLGKYLAHKPKLIGGKLQIRSHNNNQVHNLKSQNITNNVRDIMLKINKKEILNYSDVDK